MKTLSLLIKPSSNLCNMQCSYCFYNTIAEERKQKSFGMMSLETLENIVKKAFEYVDGGNITFAFQGGEPSLAGLDLYKQFIKLQKKYNVKNARVNNSFQTNGLLIDEKWAKFFKKNNFLVGLSLDGSKEINDLRRTDRNGKGTFTRVLKSKKILENTGVEYNILSVVDKKSGDRAEETYEFLKKEKTGYMQFISCLDPLKSEKDFSEYALTPEAYLSFLKELFDLWYTDYSRGKIISIRFFEDILSILLGINGCSCDMNGFCSIQNVIEADGSVYPCDFYVYEEWNLGNLNRQDFKGIHENLKCQEFIKTSLIKSEECNRCQWSKLCRGGCRRNRENLEKLNKFCRTYKEFFEYSIERFIKIAKDLTKASQIWDY